ncbi:MAG: hypothetical protein K0R49_1409 [Burkholderiales bacterium]|jgi:hypothetical protein|nr:hypothetical protein [Burkholderiales bacterium]
MAKTQKNNDGVIFPISPQKKKSGRKPETSQVPDEVKAENYKPDMPEHEDIIVDREVNIPEENITVSRHLIKPFTAHKISPEEGLSVKPSAQFDQVTTEEIIARIVNELSKEDKLISTLADEIANRLLEQMNTIEIAKFINKNSSETVNPDFIYFRENLLNYTAMLQDVVSTSIKRITTNLLTKEF